MKGWPRSSTERCRSRRRATKPRLVWSGVQGLGIIHSTPFPPCRRVFSSPSNHETEIRVVDYSALTACLNSWRMSSIVADARARSDDPFRNSRRRRRYSLFVLTPQRFAATDMGTRARRARSANRIRTIQLDSSFGVGNETFSQARSSVRVVERTLQATRPTKTSALAFPSNSMSITTSTYPCTIAGVR